MKLLYVGDIMGGPGREVVAGVLPGIREKYAPDVILAQAENVTHGKGMSIEHYHELKKLGIDGFMSGNHIFERPGLVPLLKDPNAPVTRPANYLEGTSGEQYKIMDVGGFKIGAVSLLGQIVGKDADLEMDNPLLVVDAILEEIKGDCDIVIVNFHGDYSSEKVVIGQYLDGRVAAVIGDHWHVPTADARVLPGGTAHMSDVGMVGTLDSSLGVDTGTIIRRWRGDSQGRNVIAEEGPFQFCAALIDIDEKTARATAIEPIVEYRDGFA